MNGAGHRISSFSSLMADDARGYYRAKERAGGSYGQPLFIIRNKAVTQGFELSRWRSLVAGLGFSVDCLCE